ncbi:hypothetical protein [Ramlibacter sp. AN1133]|uniref:hypothetical protein n=1 Tax=Ramlibacter sp. AN1133 TaxID=3133429 RepID=UPI0030C5A194
MDCLRTLRLVAGSLVLLAAGCGGSGGTADSGPPDTLQYLFVQTADSGSFVASDDEQDVYLLTLKGAQPVTTFFSDRPYRLAGIIETGDFVGGWNDTSDDSFLRDPPNAALQIEGAPAGADVVIVELLEVLYDAPTATLKYRAKVVRHADDSIELFHARGDSAAKIPASFGAASLFIDSWFSRAWHKVKQVADDAAEIARKQAAEAAARLKKAEGDFEHAVADNAKALANLGTNPEGMLQMADEDLHRLLTLALPSGLGVCLSVIPAEPLFDPTAAIPLSLAHVDWMAQRAASLGPRPLRQVALPGSHDSGTYPINGVSPLSKEFQQFGGATLLNDLRILFPASYPLTAAAARWSRAQRHTIAAQLLAGVRYLDLRIIPGADGRSFRATHMFAGADLDTMLPEISAFLAAHPKEVVVLDFQHLFDRAGNQDEMSAADAQELLARIVAAFGERIVTSADTLNPKDMTMNEIWGLGRQLVVLFEPDTLGRLSPASRTGLWPSEAGWKEPSPPKEPGNRYVDRFWPNRQQWDGSNGVGAYLDGEAVHIASSGNLVIVQGQMTPTPDLVKKRVILTMAAGTAKAQLDCLKAASGIASELVGSVSTHLERLLLIDLSLSLQEDAFHSVPKFRSWLRQHPQAHIVVNDFIADYPELITQIIDANGP